MLNMKKGLAVVMAAATALTFAPVAQLEAPVVAQAAQETFKVTKNSVELSHVDVVKGQTEKLDLAVSSEPATEKINFWSTNPTVASVTATKNGSDALTSGSDTVAEVSEGATLEIKGEGTGTADVKVKIGDKEFTVSVTVLDDASAANKTTTAVALSNADKNVEVAENKTGVVLGNVILTGTNYSETATGRIPGASAINATYQDITDTATTSTDLSVTVDSNPTISNNGKTASFGIKLNTNNGILGHTYKITLSGTNIDGASGVNLNASFNVKIVTKEASDFSYGGILNSIYAYKNASYDLAEHATVRYTPQGASTPINYSENELQWYLVDKDTDIDLGQERSDLKSINIPSTAGTIESGSTGSLKVTVNDPTQFESYVGNGATKKAKIVAEASVNGIRTVVYVAKTDFTVNPLGTSGDNVVVISKTITDQVTAQGTADADKDLSVLDDQIANPTQDNKYLKADDVTEFETPAKSDTHYTLAVDKASGNGNPFKGSKLDLTTLNGEKLQSGTYYETAYIPFKVNGANTYYIQKVQFVINVNTGVNFRVKDGSSILTSTYASDDDKIATDPTVYLNLADAKNWNIKDHIETDAADPSKVTYKYTSDSANVDVNADGVLTAVNPGNAYISIQATYNGIPSKTVTLKVRVNKNGFDTVTVVGKDGDQARVLNPRDYDNNSQGTDASKGQINTEEQLVTRQIQYVQIEITGNETTNVVETPTVTSANGAKLAYSFVSDYTAKGLNIDPSTGKITIDYNYCNDIDTNNIATKALGVYAVKVVSAETTKSAATTNYYYVVVDYPDQKITGLQDNYTVGACALPETSAHHDTAAVDLFTESGKSATEFKTVDKTTDDFRGASYYKNDNVDAFIDNFKTFTGSDTEATYQNYVKDPDTKGEIVKAFTDNQTEHVVAYNGQSLARKVGYTAKLITVKSAPAVENKVVKITNRDNGDVIYDDAKDAGKTATRLSINDITHIQVELEHPVAQAVSGSAVELKINFATRDEKLLNHTDYVTAVEKDNNVDITLYPNEKGTTVITLNPAGHLTATDRTDIHKKSVLLAVEYDGKTVNTAKPAQVTGVKVGNKKGAKVVVKFTKSALDKNGLSMKYYVQKKVGNKTSGKSIGSARTTLSVAKGKTVKVRVKAYYYDANGTKHVGKYSKWVTKKTDKK